MVYTGALAEDRAASALLDRPRLFIVDLSTF